jgi:hypothetical protein
VSKKNEVNEQLDATRAELADAEAALVQAERKFDADEVMNVTQRVSILRGFVAKLEAEAVDAGEAEAKKAGLKYLRGQADRIAEAVRKVQEADEAVRGHFEAAKRAMREGAGARREIEGAQLGAEIIGARFGLDVSKEHAALPQLVDWVSFILADADSLRPSRTVRRPLTVTNIASDTPAEHRRKVLVALHGWLARNGDALPAEARTILKAAPVPDSVLPPPKKVNEREQREAARMAAEVADATRALSIAPGASLTGI